MWCERYSARKGLFITLGQSGLKHLVCQFHQSGAIKYRVSKQKYLNCKDLTPQKENYFGLCLFYCAGNRKGLLVLIHLDYNRLAYDQVIVLQTKLQRGVKYA